uniref:protein SCAI n=1 Tax=Erigeron canadensis TaxID=72917 RepID=UPI001CB915E9|nr:protein SCAI [Erigeron canadensis]
MSQSNITTNYSNSNSNLNVPVSEVYWSLVAKADKKFSKIRDLPYYERNRYDTYFYKVFKVYTQLWKFQQENRHKLVEAGLKRWEIGDIASRIGQLYFGQYMRTSEASYLSESYIFYEAILTREYFKDGVLLDLNLANKQLRFLARFLTVCLVLNRREMVYQLVNQLKLLVSDCKRTFQDTDFKEWKLVIQEISKFLKLDTAFMNIRPLRYSLALDLHPDSLPPAANVKRKLKLGDAILCSYHPNEVKFSELTLDNFRMLQSLEWEPSGSFYKSSGTISSGIGTTGGQNGALLGPGRINFSQELSDPTLPPNPRKAILYRPSITHFLAVLATVCEELPPDGVLLLYLSAPGHEANNVQPYMVHPNAASTSPFPSACDKTVNSSETDIMDCSAYHSGGLNLGAKGNGGLNLIYPCDLLPFTRRPLFLVIDSGNSNAFKALSTMVKGEPVAMLLSPVCSSPTHGAIDSCQPSGSQFTSFLTAPLQALLSLLGISGSDLQMDKLNEADKVLSSSLHHWGELLASSDMLHPVWTQVLGDPFIRRLLLRFIFCRAVLALYSPTSNKKEYLPGCSPPLPDPILPVTVSSNEAIGQIAAIFGAAAMFNFPEGPFVK